MGRLDPGPELDALVAEKVMGRPGRFVDAVRINGEWREARTWLPEGWEPDDPPKGSTAGHMPSSYSTDIHAAWEVVEKLGPRGFGLLRLQGPGNAYMAGFRADTVEGQIYATAPHAICLAALKACGES